jgi:hypothetical protein
MPFAVSPMIHYAVFQARGVHLFPCEKKRKEKATPSYPSISWQTGINCAQGMITLNYYGFS